MILKFSRLYYIIITISVIALGIISRKFESVPTFIGDILYAVMVYYGFRFLFLKKGLKISAIIALVFCFSIEFMQMYRSEWVLSIRNTSLGHYALGQGFLWSDLVCYIIGVSIAFLIDNKMLKMQLFK